MKHTEISVWDKTLIAQTISLCRKHPEWSNGTIAHSAQTMVMNAAEDGKLFLLHRKLHKELGLL